MRSRTAVALTGLGLLLVQAWRSDGYYLPDEYFQTVELASHKLGVTPASDLTWEFKERMRPFFQPAAYCAVARVLRALGAPSPRAALLAFRMVGALLGWAAMLLLWRALAPRLRDERSRTALLAACLFTWYLPFFIVRTSSESLSGSLLAVALACWLLLERRPAAAAVAAGLSAGLAFDARYQVAFAIAGFAGWLALVRRAGARAVAAFGSGVLVAAAFGLAVDRWGYGAWAFTPWNYFRANLLEGQAARFGREPATFYFTSLALAHAPLSTLLLGAAVVFWARAPRDPITWMTLPFFAGHTFLAHKEVRFLVPLGVLAAAMAPLLLLDERMGLGRLRAWAASRKGRALLAGVVALDLAFVAALIVVPVRHELSVQHGLREILAEHGEAPVLLMSSDPYLDSGIPLVFVRPPRWLPSRVASWAEAEARLDAMGARGSVVAYLHDLPPEALRRRLRLVASPLPELIARGLVAPLRRTEMRALWALEE